ncbi:MAG: translation elongation factor Ts [Thermodesulfovibrionia bacterium]|nr:translation elongation factor Ts [Thermodesulfovibrionia bacterium]
MSISANDVKELREQTGVGMMQCKNALKEAEGDIAKALDILRQKGLASAAKKVGREASEGLIGSYIHMGKLGVLVEINCETDFVAKTDEYIEFVKDVAMHIAAANPTYVSRDNVPADIVAKEKEIFASQVEGKPANIVDKIVEGKLEKFYSDVCLLEQVYVKDEDQKKKIKDLVIDKVAHLGENIVIKRFVRFQLGEKAGS